MMGIYPDDYGILPDYKTYKKMMVLIAKLIPRLDEIREFHRAVRKGKEDVVKVLSYRPEELNRATKIMNYSDEIISHLDAIEKSLMEKNPGKRDE